MTFPDFTGPTWQETTGGIQLTKGVHSQATMDYITLPPFWQGVFHRWAA